MVLASRTVVALLGQVVVVGSLSTQLKSAQRSQIGGGKRVSSVQQDLVNHDDMEYTARITVGGQELNVVVDTGSYDLLVFSNKCTACGTDGFDSSKSDSFSSGGLIVDHRFGSGTCNSTDAYDDVLLGELVSNHQSFWQVEEANMPVLAKMNFQGVLGVGPPNAAVQKAKDDAMAAKYMHKHDLEQHYAELIEHAESTSSLASSLGMETFSFCLGSAPGSLGTVLWQDSTPEERGDASFITVPVEGEAYWATKLQNVKIGDKQFGTDGSDGGMAIVDTGTSLIAAPAKVVDMVSEMLASLPGLDDECSDVSSLPNIEFNIGDGILSLPPSAYAGKIVGDLASSEVDGLPSLLQKRKSGGCGSTLLKMDIRSEQGDVWVLGMPFFRKYYTTFQLDGATSSRPEAKSISFTEHDGDCRPTTSSFLQLDQNKKHQTFSVDPSMVKVPGWLRAARQTGWLKL